MYGPRRADLGALAETLVLDPLELEPLAPAAHRQTSRPARRAAARRRPTTVVGEDHRRRALRQQRLEEPQLGGVIVLDRRMVVHVVAAEIGEGAGGQPDTVEAALVEPVARRLHGRVLDAGRRQLGQQAVQGDWIGRRQGAVLVAAGRGDAGGADAGRREACLLPDLAGEGGDRSLAAGAGDGHQGGGLAAEKPGRRQRQRAPWVFNLDQGNGERLADGVGGRHDSHGAPPHGVVGVGGTVGLGARQGEEQGAAGNLARIRRDPGNGDAARRTPADRQIPEKSFNFIGFPIVLGRQASLDCPRNAWRITDRIQALPHFHD